MMFIIENMKNDARGVHYIEYKVKGAGNETKRTDIINEFIAHIKKLYGKYHGCVFAYYDYTTGLWRLVWQYQSVAS